MGISLLFPTGFPTRISKLSESTQHDLGLDVICEHVTQNTGEAKYILKVMSEMTDSPEVAAYRIDIFSDILLHKKMRDELMELLRKMRLLGEYGKIKRKHTDAPGMWELMHIFAELRDYITMVEALHYCLSDESIISTGLISLRQHIESLYTDNGFRELKDDINNIKVSVNDIKSVTLGINLDERFEATGVGLVSINNQYFTKSSIINNFSDIISSKDKILEGNEWNGDTRFYPVTIASILEGDYMADVPANFDKITDRLLDSTIKKIKNVLSKYVSVTINDITKLIPEFTYYLRWAEYIEGLAVNGYSFCKPEVVNDYSMHAEGFYNLKLTCFDTPSASIVPNDLELTKERCLYILTGANRGGKTTVTQAIGLQFVLAGGGIYVPGSKFQFSPVDCIFTHFPADEEKTMDLGRLGEECMRFRELFSMATHTSLILLNESFSTTSFEEGYYIAKDSVKAILDKGIRTIFNTHMHKLAFDIDELNESSKGSKAASLVAKTNDHERSFKVELAPPEGVSLAADIAEKYGVTYDMLMESFYSK